MSTFLFATWWGGGNQNPLLALGARLAARGHRIRVLGSRDLTPAFAAEGFERVTAAGPMPTGDEVVADIERAGADALVIDYMATDALCGAERSGVPTAALVHTLYRRLLADGELPTMTMAGSVDAINPRRGELGLPPVARLRDLLDRTAAVLVATIEELDEPAVEPVAANVHYVGPLLEGAGADAGWTAPWPAGDRRPLVLVCLGTTPMGEAATLQRIIDAVRDAPLEVLVTAGAHLEPAAFDVPDNVVITGHLRHAAVLPQAQLLVTHAGLGSVSAALAFGVPMVCLPLGREQPDNAARVVALGAGRQLDPAAEPAAIRSAIDDVLADSGCRRAANAVAAKIAAAVAHDPAVRVLESIVLQRLSLPR